MKTPERNQTTRGLRRRRAGPRDNSTTTTVPRKLALPVSRGRGLGPRNQDTLKDQIRSGRRPSPRGRRVGRCCSGRLPSRAPYVSGARSHDTRARLHSPMPTSMWPAAELRGDKSAKAARAATGRVREQGATMFAGFSRPVRRRGGASAVKQRAVVRACVCVPMYLCVWCICV